MINAFDNAWLDRYNAKQAPKSAAPLVGTPVDEEWKLHQEIIEELNRLRWLYVHSRMDKPTTTGEGVPDFIIFAPPGAFKPARVILIECKKRLGKVDDKQTIWHHRARSAGFEVHIVRSFEQFMGVIEG